MSEDYGRMADFYEVPLPDGGKLYLSNRVTNKIKADFQSWLAGNGRRDAYQAISEGPEALERSLDDLFAASGAGMFNWGGKASRRALRDIPGIAKMIALLAEAAGKTPISEAEVIELVTSKDSGMAILFGKAVREITDATPNFWSPPVIERTARA